MTSRTHHPVRRRPWAGALLVLGFLLSAVPAAHALDIVPMVGWSRPLDGEDGKRLFGGLALRQGILPLVQVEVGVAYRDEFRYGEDLRVRMLPVTATGYVSAIAPLYLGGGIGWYPMRFDYAGGDRETRDAIGTHLGGGMKVPLGPIGALDLNGRYVMLKNQESRLSTETFDPDFWMTSVGLAISF